MSYTTPPKPSSLPEDIVSKLLVHLSVDEDKYDLTGLLAFQRAANYLAAAQIFLQSNALLRTPFKQEDIKGRLLGHWGSCPGLNLVYAHSNALITRHAAEDDDIKLLYVTGPGHGAPAVLACLFLECTITSYYPQYPANVEGLEKFVHDFSWPGGFPSHVNAETPGAIHEGGELGYALAVSYGSVMDKPDLITVCVVGDGESETGPTATAWHAHKYIDPKESGAVLPILHLNGFKISERTIAGTMDDLEIACLFTGYGYQVRIVKYGEVADSEEERTTKERKLNADMATSMEWAYAEIRKIQNAARSGKPIVKPRWPILVLRTPKGMGGPKRLDSRSPIEGSFRAHQVPLTTCKTDETQFKMLQAWLESYNFPELFDTYEGWFTEETLKIIPTNNHRKIGRLMEANPDYRPLDVPDFKEFCVPDKTKEASAMKTLGKYLATIIDKNRHAFRIFSPDEFASNKLDGVFEKTNRQFQWDPETANIGGRVIEMLSEHTLEGFLQGYALTGGTGLFPSYEAFIGIVTTMVEQYAKFRKVALETQWRNPVHSLNFLETSTLWRQEHNGYSHQNPAFIGNLLTLPSHMVRIYLPPDANTTVSVMAHCLRSKDYVNLIIGSKAETPCFLTVEEAERHCIAGISIWKKYSTEEGINPDVTLVGIGVEVTIEVVAAAVLLQKEGVRVRVINVVDLMVLGEANRHPHALSEDAFNSLFGTDTPVVFNFHGYPAHVQSLLFARSQSLGRKRFEILGYLEEGTTTTPWSMLRVNKAGRFDVAERALALISAHNPSARIASRVHELRSWYLHQNGVQARYSLENGKDSEEVSSGPTLFEA